jgi:hypothetical protein
MKRVSRALVGALLAAAAGASLADDVMSPEQATRYLAQVKAVGEACETRYPNLKEAVARSWVSGWDEPTRAWAAGLMKTEAFQRALEAARKAQAEAGQPTEKDCTAMYGTFPPQAPADEKH